MLVSYNGRTQADKTKVVNIAKVRFLSFALLVVGGVRILMAYLWSIPNTPASTYYICTVQQYWVLLLCSLGAHSDTQ